MEYNNSHRQMSKKEMKDQVRRLETWISKMSTYIPVNAACEPKIEDIQSLTDEDWEQVSKSKCYVCSRYDSNYCLYKEYLHFLGIQDTSFEDEYDEAVLDDLKDSIERGEFII